MISLRKIAERLSRGKSFKRTLPKEFSRAALFISPDAQLKYLRPGSAGFDPLLLSVVQEFIKPNDIVWDVGANVGVFGWAAAGRSAEVLAIEPDPWLASLLRSSERLAANRRLKFQTLSAALSDHNGVANLMIANRGRASNALVTAGGNENMGGVREIISVPTLTLDTLLRECGPPNFVKIDVEGAESLVLKGGCRVLRESRPTWLIEVNKTNLAAVTRMFLDANYLIYDAQQPKLNRVPLEKCAFNTIAIPH